MLHVYYPLFGESTRSQAGELLFTDRSWKKRKTAQRIPRGAERVSEREQERQVPHPVVTAVLHYPFSFPQYYISDPFFCSMLAVDDVATAKSRLNFYFQTPHTSFSSVRREIMSLGRLIPVPQQQLQDLRSLIAAVTGPEKDFLEDAEVPCAPECDPVAKDNFVELPILVLGYLYYFAITPGATLPDIKFYAHTALRPGRLEFGEGHHGLDGGAWAGRVLRTVPIHVAERVWRSTAGWMRGKVCRRV